MVSFLRIVRMDFGIHMGNLFDLGQVLQSTEVQL